MFAGCPGLPQSLGRAPTEQSPGTPSGGHPAGLVLPVWPRTPRSRRAARSSTPRIRRGGARGRPGGAGSVCGMPEIVYPPVIALAKTLFRVLDLRLRVEGSEHVPTSGGAVLASNHISYLDFIFAGFGAQPAGRLVRFMAKQEVFAHPIGGPLMRGMRHIPVDRSAGAGSFEAAVKALGAGEVVGVFPEATISRSFTVKQLKSGAARLAQDAGRSAHPGRALGYPAALDQGPTAHADPSAHPDHHPGR